MFTKLKHQLGKWLLSDRWTFVEKGEYVDLNGSILAESAESEEQKIKAINVVNVILDRPIILTKWRELDEDKRVMWGGNARNALENPALIAVFGRSKIDPQGSSNGEIVKNIIEHIARHAKTEQEMNELRMTINGIELVKEYLEEMLYEPRAPDKEHLNEAI